MRQKIKYTVRFCLVTVLTLLAAQSFAQFTVTEDFKGDGDPNIIIGDGGKLTSGDEDPRGAGWLRLTKDVGNQKGYAYINRSFPSTQGVIVDIEFIMWRTVDKKGGADGISIFLFDADYGPGDEDDEFALGAYGGSLGYANSSSDGGTRGLTGGYIGVGLDAYGNFINKNEGKNGGINGEAPNSIVLRGKTIGGYNNSETNKFLAAKTIFIDEDEDDGFYKVEVWDGDDLPEHNNESGSSTKDQNVFDYNTLTTNRPVEKIYRRIQINISPTDEGTYEIDVKWATEFAGDMTNLIHHIYDEPPPEILKLGFAASTGSDMNIHEIRNLGVTTVGDIRISKRAYPDILRSIEPNNKIKYVIEVINDTDDKVENIVVKDSLTDGNGNLINPGDFEITSISTQGFEAEDFPNAFPITSGKFGGTVVLEAKTTGIITVEGSLKKVPIGNILSNIAEVIPPSSVPNDDPTNNTSKVNIPVLSEGLDLVISKEVVNSCLDSDDGNEFSLTVTNVGSEGLDYHQDNNFIQVIDTLPTGTSIHNISASGWNVSHNGDKDIYTFTYPEKATGNRGWTPPPNQDTLKSGHSLPKITYTLKDTINNGYTNVVDVELKSTGDDVTKEPPENQNNNRDSVEVLPKPEMDDQIIYLCEGEQAKSLDEYLEVEGDNELIWYLFEGGTPSNIAFTPKTNESGETFYYVSQTNGACESELAKITVSIKQCQIITNPMLPSKGR